MTRQYDANGHLSSLTYPASYLGSIVNYAQHAWPADQGWHLCQRGDVLPRRRGPVYCL